MKMILVPLDGSTLAEQVLPTVRQLAPTVGACVHLLRVVTDVDVAQSQDRLPHEALEATQGVCVERAAAYLAAQADTLHKAAISVTYEVRIGDPADQILAAAAQVPMTLIALATHGYGNIRRWALGSVSDQVVHGALVPVLLVRAVETPSLNDRPIKRILVPLDGSTLAEQALPHALSVAQLCGAEVLLITAIDTIRPMAVWSLAPFDIPVQQLYEAATITLAGIADSLCGSSVPVRTSVVLGLPAEVIVDEALRQGADLIVMATHDTSGLRRWMAGSVADMVLQATNTPLLLLRGTPITQVDTSLPARSFAYGDRVEEPVTSEVEIRGASPL